MKEQDYKLTLRETEQLCRLYMDCKLSVIEEAELQYVLGKLPYSSPCIDEVRMLMELSIQMQTRKSVKKRFGWFNRRFALGVAASAAVFFIVGIAMFNNRDVNDFHSSEIYIAYANGQKVNRELSVEQVKSDMEQADMFLNHIAKLETQELEQVENFIKHIEQ